MKRINWKNLSKWLTYGLLIAGITIPIPLLILSSSSKQNQFVLGNYQSYMSRDVMKTLSKDYDLSFDYFETAENAKRLMKRNTIDISNTTSYELINWIKEGLVKKIEWKNFEIPGVEDAEQALNLFTPAVQSILKNESAEQPINLLEYGIPYFLQDLVFVYRGTAIEEFTNNPDPDWSSVMSVLKTEARFKSKDLPNVIALNDQRTIYSIPRLIETSNDNVNPPENATIEELTNTFDTLATEINGIGKNSITFNSDSNTVLNKIALNEVTAGLTFNGDAIYASMGGDDGIEIDPDDFHCIKPTNTLVALDLMVINAQANETKTTKAYDVLKQLCLNNGSEEFDETSLTYENFDYVNYTPALQSIYAYVTNQDNEYFDNEFQYDMLRIDEVNTAQIEIPIDDLTKSNFSFAWIALKNKLN